MRKFISRSMALSGSATPTPRRTPISQEKYDELLANGLDKEVAELMFVVRAVRATKPIPTKREDGDGGTCPYFGIAQHWMPEGIDSSNADVAAGRCGFRRDGRYATGGGYAQHMTAIRPSVRSPLSKGKKTTPVS
jgi:hypothetical protein